MFGLAVMRLLLRCARRVPRQMMVMVSAVVMMVVGGEELVDH